MSEILVCFLDVLHASYVLFACSYDVMMQCWKDNPSNRPTFKSFVQQLSTLLDGLADYLDLSNLSIRKDSLFPS